MERGVGTAEIAELGGRTGETGECALLWGEPTISRATKTAVVVAELEKSQANTQLRLTSQPMCPVVSSPVTTLISRKTPMVG